MKTKEKLLIIALVVWIIAMIVMYFTDSMAYANTENDGKTFKVYKFEYDEETGYTPTGETYMNMDKLRSWVKICYFTATKLDSREVMIEFEADLKERWIVKISDRMVIKELNKIEDYYGLRCEIPD